MRKSRNVYLDSDGNGNVIVTMRYDLMAVSALKMIVPSHSRRYDSHGKVWIIRAHYMEQVVDMLRHCDFYIINNVSDAAMAEAECVTRMVIQVNYLGNVRRRPDGALTASGMNERGEWEYIFPWPVLADWFNIGITPAATANLYDRLSVSPQATTAEIKKAYRQLVRVWHPDVSQHPDAPEAFRALDEAYKTLADDKARKRYEFALKLSSQVEKDTSGAILWVPPSGSRCGLFVCDVESGFRTTIVRIHDIGPIINSAGQVMTSVWSMADNTAIFDWQ